MTGRVASATLGPRLNKGPAGNSPCGTPGKRSRKGPATGRVSPVSAVPANTRNAVGGETGRVHGQGSRVDPGSGSADAIVTHHGTLPEGSPGTGWLLKFLLVYAIKFT